MLHTFLSIFVLVPKLHSSKSRKSISDIANDFADMERTLCIIILSALIFQSPLNVAPISKYN